ncbi:anthranilate synthase component I family protein [Lysobacter korlensis]|uniref:Anthranilate synthase component I family protein n=1 Tax=Lysobacter korlensis TaxID=553636 RepID=A0ABV6RMN6_9GAMM
MRSGTLRHRLPGWIDPAGAYSLLFRDREDSFWLDSSDESGRSWMGAGVPLRPEADGGAGLLDAARAAIGGRAIAPSGRGAPLGLVGWFAYELGEWTAPAPGRRIEAPGTSAGEWLVVDRLLEFDATSREVSLLAVGDSWAGDLDRWRSSLTERLSAARDAAAPPAPPAAWPLAARWRDTDGDYLAKVEACKAAIARGDAYQLCLTTAAEVSTREHPLDVYLRLRAGSPTHHGGLLRIGRTALLSASPEQFLGVDGYGVVSTSPIKGTRPRGRTAGDDALLKSELAESDKEQAENLMIVDLMRNDLARVCELGSVEVSRLLEVESYPQVHQLVSTVRGRLAGGKTALDAVAACFPAGSMTGAPKRSAMSILAELERAPRGVYSGVFGYLGFDGTADLAMVIRSVVMSGGVATVGAGGGITALSVPEQELAEVKLKAAAPLSALGAT